jgi:3-dehydroquinate synthase
MVLASAISVKRGLLAAQDHDRVKNLLRRLKLPTRIEVEPQSVLDALRWDKKRQGDKINFVLLSGLGQAVVQEIAFQELDALVSDLW